MAPSPKAKRILIADDDPELVALLSMRLTKIGFVVSEASDGVEALEKARAERPDLLVLDVMMPRRSGWEVLRELKRDEATAQMPILMLTAIGPRLNELTSPIHGADDFLDKPFEFHDLEGKIDKLLARK